MALDCEVDAIGFVFADSVRRVSTQRATELAAPARNRVACVAVTRHPSREEVANILEKLGMRDRVELTRYAIRRGLIQP